jgi:hypothetical protein
LFRALHRAVESTTVTLPMQPSVAMDFAIVSVANYAIDTRATGTKNQ